MTAEHPTATPAAAPPAGSGFVFLLTGQIIVLFGSALLRFALSLHVLDLTGRADVFATLYALSSVPLLLAPGGGAIADRVNRRNLLVGIAAINAVVVGALVAAFAAESANLVVIAAVMVALGATSAVEMPTVLACVPGLVRAERLEQSNGLINGVSALAGLIAPAAGGALYGAFPLETLTIASAVTFAAGAGIELFIRLPRTAESSGRSFAATLASDLKEGFRYAITQSAIRQCMILSALINLVLVPVFVVGVPVILRQAMRASNTWYGVGMALIESGMIVGALTLGLVARRIHLATLHRWLLAIAFALVPAGLALTPTMLNAGFVPSFALFFAFAVAVLVVLAWSTIFVLTAVQRRTPDRLLGKVMAIVMAASQCAAPVGQVLYGRIEQHFTGAWAVPVLGVAACTLAIAVAARRMLRGEDFAASAA